MSMLVHRRGIQMALAMRRWANRKGGKKAKLDDFDRSDDSTLASLVDAWLEELTTRAYSARSVETARWAMRAFLCWAEAKGLQRPGTVTRAVIEDWQRELAKGKSAGGRNLSVATQCARLGHVQRFFAWLCLRGLLTTNPAAFLEMPRRQPAALPKALGLQQIRALLAAPDTADPIGVRDRAILEVLYTTGMRRREAAMLDVADVNLSENTLLVRHGKGNKPRLLPLGRRAAGWVRCYLEAPRPLLADGMDEPALFLTGYGSRNWRTTIRRLRVAAPAVINSPPARVPSCQRHRPRSSMDRTEVS